MTLLVGTALPQRVLARTVLDVARECEGLGYASAFVFDHLVPLGAPDGTPMLEAYTTLAAVAAATSTLRLATLVSRAAMRPPAMTTHLARSVRALAGDRFVLGLGAGDASSAREDALLGQPSPPAAERLDRLRATVAAIRDGVPGQVVWVGGMSAAVRRLAAEVADGWNAWAATPSEVDAGLPYPTWGGQVLLADDAAERVADWSPGRGEDEKRRVVSGGPDAVAAGLLALAAAGVRECFVSFVGGDAAGQRRRFAREVLPLLG